MQEVLQAAKLWTGRQEVLCMSSWHAKWLNTSCHNSNGVAQSIYATASESINSEAREIAEKKWRAKLVWVLHNTGDFEVQLLTNIVPSQGELANLTDLFIKLASPV